MLRAERWAMSLSPTNPPPPSDAGNYNDTRKMKYERWYVACGVYFSVLAIPPSDAIHRVDVIIEPPPAFQATSRNTKK